jgi:hypothetical protein
VAWLFDHGYALVIGVGAYQHLPQLDVPLAVADAQALAGVLCDPQYCGYRADQVAVLTNATATRLGILSAIDTLASRAERQSTILLFYSGHGHYGADGMYYLTSHDTRFTEDRKVLANTAVSQQELLSRLQALQAERVVLMFNACHAGELSPTLSESERFTGQSLPSQTAAALLATGTGRIIMTACREHQYSFVGNGALTIFGGALVEGLRGKAARSQSGYVSAFDLYTYLYDAVGATVKREVPEATRRRYGEAQEPELTVLKGVGPFAVALNQATPVDAVDVPAQPIAGRAVRQLSADESQIAFQQIQSGGVNFGHQNTVEISGDVVGSDKLDISGSQNPIIRPSGPVNQRNINTGGGDYAEGDINKSQGVFISGGTITGTVVGVNSGTITTHINAPHSGAAQPRSLEQLLDQLQRRAALARQLGDADLAEDLEGGVVLLNAALRAQKEQRADRRLAKLGEVRAIINRLVATYPDLHVIAAGLAAAD